MVTSATKLLILRERVADEGGLQRPKGSSPQDTERRTGVDMRSNINSHVNSSSVVAGSEQ